jgi:ubiquitin fusion degradation protein 1
LVDFGECTNITVINLSPALPKGTFVKIQPHMTKFIQLSNPKAVLEKSLRSFSCITAGDTILISYADTEFDIDVLEVKPNTLDAISLIDTDVQVSNVCKYLEFTYDTFCF